MLKAKAAHTGLHAHYNGFVEANLVVSGEFLLRKRRFENCQFHQKSWLKITGKIIFTNNFSSKF